MKRLYTILITLLCLQVSCSDSFEESSYTICPTIEGRTQMEFIFNFKNAQDGNLLYDTFDIFQDYGDTINFDPHTSSLMVVDCIRQTDGATMVFPYCSLIRFEDMNDEGHMLYLKWMDMDALTSKTEYDEVYSISIRSPKLWNAKEQVIDIKTHVYHGKMYPLYISINNDDQLLSYASINGQYINLITLTPQ